jgi:hypothetical protein
MRTTLSIDDHVLAEYKKLAAKTHRTLSAVIQDALLETLSRRRVSATSRPLKLPVIGGGGFCPGVDLDDNARTLELLEQERDEALSRHPEEET